MPDPVVVVVGLGEIGRPLLTILSRKYVCKGVDVEPADIVEPCSVMHICVPYQVADFVAIVSGYIRKYRPQLTIVHSTVIPGTTRLICENTASSVAYSPVRGKHAHMERDMLRYNKFVAGIDPRVSELAVAHLSEAGFKTETFRTPEIGELTKLLETTWLGVLIGWTQEMERFAQAYGASFEEINTFIKEIDFLPSSIFPGFIGGHCVMPNIALLQKRFQSLFLDAIVHSNKSKEQALPNSQQRQDNYESRIDRLRILGPESSACPQPNR